MPHRVPLHTIVVSRDGKRVSTPPGKPFDFSDEELEHLESEPGMVRELITEQGEVVPGAVEPVGETDLRRQPPRRGGRRAAGADDL
jgi:hypothetical protein